MGNSHSLRFARSLALLSATGALACSTPPTVPDSAVREAGLADQSMVADAELDSSDGAIASIDAEAGSLLDAGGPETYGPFPDGTVCVETDAHNGTNPDASLQLSLTSHLCPQAPAFDGTCCSVAGLTCSWLPGGGQIWTCNCTSNAIWSCRPDLAGPCAPPELSLTESRVAG